MQETQKEDFELLKLLEDMHALQEKFGYEKIVLIGHSIHALIALEYTKKYPDKVSKLILIAAIPIHGQNLHQAANRAFLESVCPKRKELLSQNMNTFEEKMIQNPDQSFITRMLSFGPMLWFDPTFDASSLWKGVTFNKTGAAVIWGEMFNLYDIRQNIESIACPVFLGLGRYDFFNPPYLWESVRSYFKNLTIPIFEKSGHTPQLEEADLFDGKISEFIQTS